MASALSEVAVWCCSDACCSARTCGSLEASLINREEASGCAFSFQIACNGGRSFFSLCQQTFVCTLLRCWSDCNLVEWCWIRMRSLILLWIFKPCFSWKLRFSSCMQLWQFILKKRWSMFLDPNRLYSQLMALCQPMSAHSIQRDYWGACNCCVALFLEQLQRGDT